MSAGDASPKVPAVVRPLYAADACPGWRSAEKDTVDGGVAAELAVVCVAQ